MDTARVVVRVSAESAAACRTLAKARGIELGEAVDLLVSQGHRRFQALKKYAAKPLAKKSGRKIPPARVYVRSKKRKARPKKR